ncbi:MAG: DUF1501 domain-containing protein [Pirellulaceae bacterium]
MFTIQGESIGPCDRLRRCDLLKIGARGLGFGSLNLADLLRSEGQSSIQLSGKTVINIHLEGGLSQMDTWDMKPDGPVDLRGELRPIQINLPGTQIGELLPRLSRLADKFTN